MAYKISDACISCGACASECPVGAISEGDQKYEINADECLSCGNGDYCEVPVVHTITLGGHHVLRFPIDFIRTLTLFLPIQFYKILSYIY